MRISTVLSKAKDMFQSRSLFRSVVLPLLIAVVFVGGSLLVVTGAGAAPRFEFLGSVSRFLGSDTGRFHLDKATLSGSPKTSVKLSRPARTAVEGSATSSAALVAKPASPMADRAVRLVPVTGAPDTDIFVEVELEAQGNEVGMQYSIHFDSAVLSISSVSGVNVNPDITLGSGAPAATSVNVNAAGAAAGNLGIGQNFNGGNTNPATVVPAGTQRIARLKFHILSSAASGDSAITFTSNPINRGLFDENGFTIPLPPFTDGVVTVGAASATFSISGRITTPAGTGLRNTTVFMIDPQNVKRTATTSSFGFYQFDSVASGQTYTIGVSSRSYRFSTRQVNVTGNLTNIDFVGLE